MRLSLALIAAIGFVLPGPSDAPANVASLLRQFEKTYNSARSLRANFLETYFDNGKEVRAEAGVAYFSKPGRMRWEYASPESNLYLVDGKWSWFYVPADHTVTRIRAKQSSDARTPLALQRALLDPAAATLPANRSIRAVTRDGRTVRGRRLNEDAYTIQLIDDQSRLVSFTKTDLRSFEVIPAFSMPSYETTLTADERADVIAYLLSLKGR